MARPPRVKTVRVAELVDGQRADIWFRLQGFPNFSKKGSVRGMRAKYFGNDAYLVKCGWWIYKVDKETYDKFP